MAALLLEMFQDVVTGRNSDEMDLEEITEELRKEKKVCKVLKKKKNQMWTYYLVIFKEV